MALLLFSEENVWHMCSKVKETRPEELERCYCVFISNICRTIPLWCQKSSTNEEGYVVWDYHVIFIHMKETGAFVYDLDSILEFPCEFEEYFNKGVKNCDQFKGRYRRCFRVIPAEEFLETFASDRSHMLDENKEWLTPPPDYPCIRTEASVNNIQDFISVEGELGPGTILSLGQFYSKFTLPSTEK